MNVYLDHAATTAMLPEAIDAMAAELSLLGNPSSLHSAGRRARRVVEESRETIAGALGARPSEVVFTSGGTEADNLAVKGLYWARRAEAPARRRVLVSAIEHHAVLDSAHWLAEHEGAVIEELPVDAEGRVSPETLRAAIARAPSDVAMVSIMWANNEVGTVQPIAELAAVAAEYGVPFHSDAVQAVGQLDVDFAASGAAALTVTGHKVGGPIGAGALLLARGVDPVPVLHGGGQERDVRSGTLATPLLAGFATAVRAAVSGREAYAARIGALRDELVERVRAAVPDVQLNGPELNGRELNGRELNGRELNGPELNGPELNGPELNGPELNGPELNGPELNGPVVGRLPANAHLSFPGCEGDSLLMLLDAQGIECSTGSACSAGVAQPSHVLLAMGADAERARGSLRFSFGHTSTKADVDALADAIAPAVTRARQAGLT